MSGKAEREIARRWINPPTPKQVERRTYYVARDMYMLMNSIDSWKDLKPKDYEQVNVMHKQMMRMRDDCG